MNKLLLSSMLLAGLVMTNGRATDSYAADPDTRAALAGSPISANSQKEIEKTLADVITEVLDKDVEDVIDDFSKPDRERLGKKSESTPGALKTQVQTLKDAWKSKYGKDFSLQGAEIPYQITQTDAKGMRAEVALPTNSAVSGLKLDLVNEGSVTNAWRIDLPDTTSTAALKSNIERAVRELNESVATWPATEKDAYRAVALKLLGAISGNVA